MMEQHVPLARWFQSGPRREVVARPPQCLTIGIGDRSGSGSGPKRVIDHQSEDSTGTDCPCGFRKETTLVLDVLEGQDAKCPVVGIVAEEPEIREPSDNDGS